MLIRLFWPSHEKVRSTTHLLGSTLKPLGGISLCQSTSLPSLAHYCAQRLATFSGTGFLGLAHDLLHAQAILSSAHLLPLPW